MVVCHGQTIDLPDGSYKAIHLLAAATGGSPVQATFAGQPVTIADWTHAPTNAELGFRCLYQLGKNGPEPGAVYLGDYAIPLAADRRLTELTLPSAPGIKIVAITLER